MSVADLISVVNFAGMFFSAGYTVGRIVSNLSRKNSKKNNRPKFPDKE